MKQDTKTTLMGHALSLFSSKGYDGVGVQQIVDAGQVSKPTMYHHFRNKIGLLDALLAEEINPLLVALADIEFTGDLEQDLILCGTLITEYAKAHGEAYRLFLSLMYAPPESPQFEVAATYANRQFLAIERAFRLHLPEMENEFKGDCALYAANFQGLLHTTITLFFHGHIQLDARIVRRTVHVFVHGLHAVHPFNTNARSRQDGNA